MSGPRTMPPFNAYSWRELIHRLSPDCRLSPPIQCETTSCGVGTADTNSDLSIEAFVAQLETVPWFSELGQPGPADAEATRIFSWDEWPGPEDPSVNELALGQQALYDGLLETAGEKRQEFLALWDRIQETVFRAARTRVPYDPEEDCYHGPTAALWQAAWTAGLIGWCLYVGQPVPGDLREQWQWYLAGHWPAGYSWLSDDKPGPLLVY